MKFKVVKPCVNQDDGSRLKPDDIITEFSDFERSRHLAEGNVIPLADSKREKAVSKQPEKRKRRTARNRK